MNARPAMPARRQHGLATIEFALIAAIILIPLMFGIMEFGRIVFYWNAATEATRLGARLAVVCDMNDATIKERMSALFPVITAETIKITYEPGACAIETCRQVRVEIVPTVMPTYIPFISFSPKFPPFVTSLPRESMASSFAGHVNPVCT